MGCVTSLSDVARQLFLWWFQSSQCWMFGNFPPNNTINFSACWNRESEREKQRQSSLRSFRTYLIHLNGSILDKSLLWSYRHATIWPYCDSVQSCKWSVIRDHWSCCCQYGSLNVWSQRIKKINSLVGRMINVPCGFCFAHDLHSNNAIVIVVAADRIWTNDVIPFIALLMMLQNQLTFGIDDTILNVFMRNC